MDAVEYSALEIIDDDEAISISVPPALPPSSHSLQDYVDRSETLSKLVELGNSAVYEVEQLYIVAWWCVLDSYIIDHSLNAGVNLWKLEQRPNVGSMLMKLNFDTDVAPKLLFLKDIGVDGAHFGHIITHNPFLLMENLENLKAR